jgi:uncharacterized protein YodC (DUF2158 family)
MFKIIEKITSKLIELSVEKLLGLFLLTTGVSVLSVWSFFKYTFVISIGQFLAILIVVIITNVFYFLFKAQIENKSQIKSGDNVILNSGHGPIMAAGRFSFLTNKIECTWFDKGEAKSVWIYQTQLQVYVKQEKNSTPRRKSSHWTKLDDY